MAESAKDTIYIDVDDEITTVIDKLQASPGKVVALVLPKRAATLQSIVNMKLLKRAVDQSGKNAVLITTESGILPLAGAVGLHVAATPTSRPEIPAAPAPPTASEEQVDETAELLNDDSGPLAPATPVGQLAGDTMPLPPTVKDSAIETVELDNAELPAAAAVAAGPKPPKPKKDKKLHVPNFDRFRLVAILGVVLLVILIVGGYLGLVVLPKATIAIQTDASTVNTSVDLTLNTGSQNFSATSMTVPATQAQSQKTYTGTATATGQQNNGQKAHGQIIITTEECAPNLGDTPSTLPAGTGVSSGGQTYITQDAANFSQSRAKGSCIYYTSNSVDITAQSGGSDANTSDGADFAVSGQSNDSASGSAAGGTDQIVTVVSQADVDSAKAKITTSDSSVQASLASQLKGQELYAITATYNAGTPSVTQNANVGDQASSVSVTETITYTMLGANQANIKTLVDNNIKTQIDTSKQGILDEGITEGAFKLTNLTSSGAALSLQTSATVGPTIDTASIASQAAGMKSGDIESSVKSDPDVTNVTVHLSPFWVTKAPKNTSKITVTVAKPTSTASAN